MLIIEQITKEPHIMANRSIVTNDRSLLTYYAKLSLSYTLYSDQYQMIIIKRVIRLCLLGTGMIKTRVIMNH